MLTSRFPEGRRETAFASGASSRNVPRRSVATSGEVMAGPVRRAPTSCAAAVVASIPATATAASVAARFRDGVRSVTEALPCSSPVACVPRRARVKIEFADCTRLPRQCQFTPFRAGTDMRF